VENKRMNNLLAYVERGEEREVRVWKEENERQCQRHSRADLAKRSIEE